MRSFIMKSFHNLFLKLDFANEEWKNFSNKPGSFLFISVSEEQDADASAKCSDAYCDL